MICSFPYQRLYIFACLLTVGLGVTGCRSGQVRVVDAQMQPLEGAEVAAVTEDGQQAQAVTGSDGWAKLNLRGDVAWLMILKDGYTGKLYDGPLRLPGTAPLSKEGQDEELPGDADRLLH